MVVLLNLHNLYESLYDLLNQVYYIHSVGSGPSNNNWRAGASQVLVVSAAANFYICRQLHPCIKSVLHAAVKYTMLTSRKSCKAKVVSHGLALAFN